MPGPVGLCRPRQPERPVIGNLPQDDTAQPYDVFLSYRHGSALEWVRGQIFERLQAQGRTAGRQPRIFIDLYGMQAGLSWLPQLAKSIETCRRFVPVFTPGYFESDMCRWEMERAYSLDPAGRKGFVIPVLGEGVEVLEIPFEYRGLQFIDTRNPRWFSELCHRLDFVAIPPAAQTGLVVRTWVEPTSSRPSRTRDISLIPRQLSGVRFALGTEIRIGFQTNRDCYVTIVDIGTSGTTRIIYPQEGFGLHFCAGGSTHYFPADSDPFSFVLTGAAGKEKVCVFAAAERTSLDEATLFSHVSAGAAPAGFVEARCEFEIVEVPR